MTFRQPRRLYRVLTFSLAGLIVGVFVVWAGLFLAWLFGWAPER